MTAIAVSGHRVLAEVEQVAAGLERVVRRLEAAYPGGWTVVSALAEGADRLVVDRLLARAGTRLAVVLPLARDEYEADFETGASRAEFRDLLARAAEVTELPPRPDRNAAYEAGGRAMLDRCDALVTVWDGQGAQDYGGTGGIVARARERGLPVAWIHAGNRRPGTDEPTALGAEQGEVTLERWPRA